MKLNKCLMIKILSLSVLALTFLLCSDSYAVEEVSRGRKIWDIIMLWINFGILVFLFIKFGKKPLMDFLYGERDKIGESIDDVDKKLQEARSLMEAEAVKLESMDERLKSITKTIIELGENEKTAIISKAKDAAEKMVEDAKSESEYRLIAAKNSFSEEMMEMAISISVDSLKKSYSFEDEDKIIDEFNIGIGKLRSDFS